MIDRQSYFDRVNLLSVLISDHIMIKLLFMGRNPWQLILHYVAFYSVTDKDYFSQLH